MSENNNEQMDLGSGTASNNEITEAAVPTTSPNAEVTTTENTTSKLKLAIKTPKEKKDILIDGSSTVKQVIYKINSFFFEYFFFY
jgi:hypothetical protein